MACESSGEVAEYNRRFHWNPWRVVALGYIEAWQWCRAFVCLAHKKAPRCDAAGPVFWFLTGYRSGGPQKPGSFVKVSCSGADRTRSVVGAAAGGRGLVQHALDDPRQQVHQVIHAGIDDVINGFGQIDHLIGKTVQVLGFTAGKTDPSRQVNTGTVSLGYGGGGDPEQVGGADAGACGSGQNGLSCG
jgi:hypothetical protein